MNYTVRFLFITLSFFLFSCSEKTNRQGIVIDKLTRIPIPNVQVDVYLGHLNGDSLKTKIFTDSSGYFFIPEKRNSNQLFFLEKENFISFVSKLSTDADTIELEKELD